jgi:tRNA-binding protein
MSGDAVPPRRPELSFAGFESVDMRAGRVVSAEMAIGTRAPSRVIRVDLGSLGIVQSVGQLALVPEAELVGRNVVVCINLGPRKIGRYVSEALVLGVPHPDSPEGQAQATPLYVDGSAEAGSQVF